MAVQLQWSLDKTIGSALSVARGIFLAANNDNVQPLAIVSCETFGNTVAMCQETCRSIENLTAKTPKSIAIEFLRASAGFDAADSASQLSKSQAGVQFLGLAAALVTSMGAFEGGMSLQKMLETSASDKTLLPSARQLKDLLLSLEPRLVQSGFLNTVIGWQLFLTQSFAMPREYQEILRRCQNHPGPLGINHLVDAFRGLSRIGESNILRVTIKVTSCASWIVAFTKWCLGLPPSIYLDDGTSVLEQPNTKVDVIIDTKTGTGLHVSIHRAIGEPFDLVEDLSSKEWTGMVNAEEYSRWNLSELGFDTEIAKEALLEALPFAIKQIIQTLRFSAESDPWATNPNQYFNPNVKALSLSPFPEESVIAQTASRYLGGSDVMMLHFLTSDFDVKSLPAVKLHLKSLKETCLCSKCSTLVSQGYRQCKTEKFCDRLTFVCADILALSLFGTRIPLLRFKRGRNGDTEFTRAISSIISSEFRLYEPCIQTFDLLRYALELTGHEFINDSRFDQRWIMSSFKGQVIYPTLYETLSYEKTGHLTLNCLPGRIRYNGEVYTRVHARLCSSRPGPLRKFSGPTVTVPRNLVPDLRVVWLVEQADDVLEVSLSLKGPENDYSRVSCQPSEILWNLSSSILLEACAHDPDAELAPDKFCVFTSPIFPIPFGNPVNEVPMTGVVAVDGSDELRLLSLANGGPAVLRKKACLACCLDVCRRADYPFLVL